MALKNNKRAREALFIGLLCSISYLAVYVARNVLSTVTPQMVEGGEFTKEYIGEISSLFFIFYAIGQLLNGFLGDRIKARYMLSIGLLLAGIVNFVFPYILHLTGIAKLAYGVTGFFLSMIYGPMTKLVAENTMPEYTTKCSLGYSLASYLGSPMAGAIAAILSWKSVFVASSIALIVMAMVCFASIFYLEKSGVVIHNRYKELKKVKKEKSGIIGTVKILLKRRIVLFSLVSILTGVVRTTVVFWLPTYFSEHLGYAPKTSAAIFTVATLAISLTVFLSVAIYKLFRQNLYSTVLVTFLASAVYFLFVYLVDQPVINIIFIVLGVMSSNPAATMLWCMYCPSLHDTGMVSAATGFLAFIGYVASSASSTLFANAATTIGWGNLILVWSGLMALGVIVTLPRIFIKSK